MLTDGLRDVEDVVRSDELMIREFITLHRITSNAQLKHEPTKSSARHKNAMAVTTSCQQNREVLCERREYRGVRGVPLG